MDLIGRDALPNAYDDQVEGDTRQFNTDIRDVILSITSCELQNESDCDGGSVQDRRFNKNFVYVPQPNAVASMTLREVPRRFTIDAPDAVGDETGREQIRRKSKCAICGDEGHELVSGWDGGHRVESGSVVSFESTANGSC